MPSSGLNIEIDNAGAPYIGWSKYWEAKITYNLDNEWETTTVDNIYFSGECEGEGWTMKATGSGVVYVTGSNCGTITVAKSEDGGQSWSQTSGNFYGGNQTLATAGPNEIYLIWEEEIESGTVTIASSADSGNSWVLGDNGINALTGGAYPKIVAGGSGQLLAGWESAGFLYTARYAGDGTPYLAPPAAGETAVAVWNGPDANQTWAAVYTPDSGQTYAIAGAALTGSGTAIPDTTINFTAHGNTVTATTDGSDHFTSPDLAEGTWTIAANKSGYVFLPAVSTLTVPPDVSDITFSGDCLW